MDLPARWPQAPASVVHVLAGAARAAPDAEALVCGDDRLGYDGYWRAVQTMARQLRGEGVAPGDRVAVILPNGLEIAVASLAVMAAGAVLVPLNPLYTAHELTYILGDAAPRLVIAAPGHDATTAAQARLPGPIPTRAPVIAAEAAEAELLPDPGSLGMIQYTGGTTGKPKGVMLGHDALAANVAQREARLPTRWQQERVLIVTPLYHSYATAMGLFLAANCAGALHVLPRYDGQAVIDTIAAARITIFAGSPAIYGDLLSRPDLEAADLSSLRLCYSGSAPLSRGVHESWEARLRCPILEGYGQTEAGPVLSFMDPEGARMPGTVGTALPGTEIGLVDSATGAPLTDSDAPGEIRARGPQIMRGYWNNPDESAAALRDGWLHTGDIGTLDRHGVLTIRDRKKDMVIVSGFNVYPREIEEALFAHPQVREAAVVGRPDPRKGEALVAFVVPVPEGTTSDAELRAFLAERLTRYKLPTEIRFVGALPRSPIGKIDKTVLRAKARG